MKPAKELIEAHPQTPAAKAAIDILEAGLAALNPEQAVFDTLKREGNLLHINNQTISLAKKRIFVFGAGKGSGVIACALEKLLGSLITDGIIIDVEKHNLKRITSVIGNHPVVSAKNVVTTKKILTLTETLNVNDLVICVFTGGGSALFSDPLIPLADYQALMHDLLKSGATITELNTIRKHVDGVKGGRFAHKLFPATVLTLLVSDVPNNDPAIIASGPTVLDTTTVKDARTILSNYGLNQAPLTETPKEPLRKLTNHIILDNNKALAAMQDCAATKKLDYHIIPNLHGEARNVGVQLLKKLDARSAIICAGETTVTVKGNGKGGRNQELVLGAVTMLAERAHTALASLNTDGNDNTDMAGAYADDTTKRIADKRKLDIKQFLDNNDSYPFFAKVNGHLKTGKTGINVADLIVAVRL